MLQSRVPSGAQTQALPQTNARHLPMNGQARRRPVEAPGSNTRVCRDFVCSTHRQKGASWLFIRLVRFLVSSSRVEEGSGRENMVLITVEPVPAGSKPPVAIRVRISTGERQGFDAAAPLSIRASSLAQGRAGGLVRSSRKLYQTHRVGIDLGKIVIPTYHLFCCNVLRTVASLLV